MNRRQLLLGASIIALNLGISIKFAVAATAISDVWMETPDVLAFTVEDDLPLMGNIFDTGSPVAQAYDTWFTSVNPRSGNSEFGQVIGPTKQFIRFSDQPPVSFVNDIPLRIAANYSITGGVGLTVSAVYFRTEANSQAQYWTGSQTLGAGCRRTFLLKLGSRPIAGQVYNISHSSGALTAFNFTFNDKTIRAGGIKVSFAGHRRNDTWKKAYLASRLPLGPNNGVVDFAAYGLTLFSIIDSNGWVWFTGPITLRRAWNQLETGDGYTVGLDIADPSQSWTVTAITKANPAVVTAPGHGFVNGDKCRFFGISGMTQIQNIGATGGAGLWVAATITVIDANNFSVNINSTTFSTFSTGTYNTSLGGVENKVYKCFNTNRAGTNVYECDFSSWLAPQFGQYRIYIPGYGISDSFLIDDCSHAICGAKHHEGTYNQRLGIALTQSPSYQRGIALADGVDGCINYWSSMPSLVASETGNKIGTSVPSGLGAFASDNNVIVQGVPQGFGWVTTTRFNGWPAHQDAGDNDDIGVDHLPGFNILAMVFHDLPVNSRFLPFNVQLSSQVLNSTLFAGTDLLPPLFHEMAWHFEAYRSQMRSSPSTVAGSIPGGWGLGHFSSQVPNYPEPINYYRGTDAGGSLAGQTVMAFIYASDAITNMVAAYSFAKFAQIAYSYNLTLLGDTYKQAAIDAFNWSDGILKNLTTRDNYYDGVLNLTTRMSWNTASKNSFFVTHNQRLKVAKLNASGALYRLLGSVDGQTTYGDYIDALYTATAAVSAGGSGYVVGDIITLVGADAPHLIVATLSGSAVATVTILYPGTWGLTPPTNPVAQASTNGVGTGATFTLGVNGFNNWNLMPATIGAWDYINTLGAKSTPRNYMLAHAFDGAITNTNFWLSSETCFQGMWSGPGSTGGAIKIFNALQTVQLHMTYVLQNGITLGRSSVYLQSMQAGIAFVMGANMPGKSFTTDFGIRHTQCMLHEDTFKLGVQYPPGQTTFGYFAWVGFLGGFNYALGPNSDGPLNWIAEDTTGSFEATPNFGSKKMWNPARIASSYWEWSPENKGMVFPCEFDIVGSSLANTYLTLYLHGWDGNTATEVSNKKFGWRI